MKGIEEEENQGGRSWSGKKMETGKFREYQGTATCPV